MKISIILKDLFYWLLRPNKRQVQNDHKCPPWQRHCLPWIWDVEKLRCIFVCLTCRIVLVSSSWFWQDKHQYPGLRCFILVFWPYQQSSKSGLKDKKNSPNIISFRFFFFGEPPFFQQFLVSSTASAGFRPSTRLFSNQPQEIVNKSFFKYNQSTEQCKGCRYIQIIIFLIPPHMGRLFGSFFWFCRKCQHQIVFTSPFSSKSIVLVLFSPQKDAICDILY